MPNLLYYSLNVKLSFLTLNLAVFAVFLFLMLSYSENDRFQIRTESANSAGPSLAITVYNAKNKTMDINLMAKNKTMDINMMTKNKTMDINMMAKNKTMEINIMAKNKTMELNMMNHLGDQMFMYASLLGLAIANNRQPMVEGASRLGQIFQITYKASNIRHITETAGWFIQQNENIVKHELLLLPPTNITLRGRFQSWRYFYHIRKRIRREFVFQPELKEIAETFYDNLRNGYSSVTVVGVHAYRGKNKLSKYNVMVAPLSYFIKAIKLMRTYVQGQVLFIVSTDDPLWCRENFSDQQDLIVLDSGPPAGHLAILASTSHVIISTGSFGWWAAWLADGVTIYYKPEDQLLSESDYFPDNWHGIGD